MKRIVGVHGIGNYQSGLTPQAAAAVLTDVWSTALGADVDLVVSYYAHHLKDAVAQGAGTPEDLDGEAVEMLASWERTLELDESAAHGRLMSPARWLIERITGSPFSRLPAQLFTMLFIREVQAYLGKANDRRRVAARDEVADTIWRHRPEVVIAHSLGSVVAYEALWAHPALAADLFVTIGSPLAMPHAVYHRLDPVPPANGVLAPRPPGVRRWVNLADPGDICAVPRWLGRAFDLDDDQETSIGTFAFHKAVKYLASAELGAVLG